MASSRISSNVPDWQDTVANLVAFEAMNNVRIEVRLSTADYHGMADVAIALLAHSLKSEDVEAPTLASVSLRCSATNLSTLESVLIHGLYLLDSQLGKGEFANVVKTG